MNFKIDENLPIEIAELLIDGGHSAATVSEQGIGGYSDSKVIDICVQESRALVTLDLDFSDIRKYPPQNFPGIIVMRGPEQSKVILIELARQIISALLKEPLRGHLWIVEQGRVRIRGQEE